MILGIDASNLRRGGGVTHLVELLRNVNPQESGFDQVLVWGGSTTLNAIEERPWLQKSHDTWLDGILPLRLIWQHFRMPRLARKAGIDLLFVPGGSGPGGFRPIVAMSQNMLPFQWKEMSRYGAGWVLLRILLLYISQTRSFRRADGVIFLTSYARDEVLKRIGARHRAITVIPHGVSERFRSPPRPARSIADCSRSDPMRILYVSTIDAYKHPWHVVDAVARLRRQGYPVSLDLVGPVYVPSMRRLKEVCVRLDPDAEFLKYRGSIDYSLLHETYACAEVNVFASSCENMPLILLEAMASGLPIACSDRGPMPGMLRDAGVYFDPEDPSAIAEALKTLIDSPGLREKKAQAAFALAGGYSWKQCSRETFDFLSSRARAGRPTGAL